MTFHPTFAPLAELTQTMAQAEKGGFGPATMDNTAGLSLPYNHGNQPGLHTAWLFHFVGRADLSQRYVRSICERFYGTTPMRGYGLGQDEDQGQLVRLVCSGLHRAVRR